MTEVLDVEAISDEATFTPEYPLGGSVFGWCNDGLHPQCPAILEPMKMGDPSRKGTFYTLPGRRCPCICHTRPLP